MNIKMTETVKVHAFHHVQLEWKHWRRWNPNYVNGLQFYKQDYIHRCRLAVTRMGRHFLEKGSPEPPASSPEKKLVVTCCTWDSACRFPRGYWMNRFDLALRRYLWTGKWKIMHKFSPGSFFFPHKCNIIIILVVIMGGKDVLNYCKMMSNCMDNIRSLAFRVTHNPLSIWYHPNYGKQYTATTIQIVAILQAPPPHPLTPTRLRVLKTTDPLSLLCYTNHSEAHVRQ